jgi:hypothetical protein
MFQRSWWRDIARQLRLEMGYRPINRRRQGTPAQSMAIGVVYEFALANPSPSTFRRPDTSFDLNNKPLWLARVPE